MVTSDGSQRGVSEPGPGEPGVGRPDVGRPDVGRADVGRFGGGRLGGAGLKSGRLRSRRARLVLALAAGMMGLLCLGGAGIFFILYDDATEIERTAPDVVVDNFLGAYLVKKDDNEAALYRCDSGDFAALHDFRTDTEKREAEHAVGISVTWSSLDVQLTGGSGVVATDLTRTITRQTGRDRSSWKFTVVDHDGWRVCGATRIS